MPINVIFPKVSLEMASGSVSRWHVREGDTVVQGQVLFEIDNDKAAVEVESPGSGIIRHLVGSDVEVEVGAEVARILAPDEAVADAAPAAMPVVQSAVPATAEQKVAAARGTSRRAMPNPTPLARRLAREYGVSIEGLKGTGPRSRVQKKDVLAGLAQPATARAAASVAEGPFAPAVAGSQLLNAVWLRRGDGLPVVLLHGFSGDLNNWRGLFAGGRSAFPALALDLPAHGQSPRGVPDDLDDMAELVEATLAAQNIGPMILAGHSLGGALAARVARRAQADIRGLCLFAPAGLGPQINAPFTEGVVRARSAESVRPWLELLVHDPATISDAFVRAVVQQRKDEDLTAAIAGFANRFFPDGTQSFSVAADLAKLPQIVRVVFGRQDRVLPFASTRGLPDNVALHAFDACGHMPHLEKPELALRILSEVWRSA
ncbi:pyruvate dehydrogenase E2 component (dihydrolipoamide acetyltransferase) [Angulomicrobium tetraedrale]|uniref:Pyruvate dehydrogenase E2 component (Dihydrolipoamide acetyltransferase) n=1 Tax=Ancylobacter tetraedralis TaxID=217068 RepID=A0A839ZDB0_9HYPH|nr:acetoin dehydrogenase dihydrolipoyllysine-residue acetyltransferase subunit [Ancylobacter tetraedralis]MBB3772781.1 pyruvate dehydrogenase E2 component (dihydrolipoamide acetyltransferase) [Ancylobacter tetraedralis]